MSELPERSSRDDESSSERQTTHHVDSEEGDYAVPRLPDSPTLMPGAIAFYLPGRAQPVVFKNQQVIVVGRFSAETPDVLLDLTSDHGVLLGVSRRHAVIEWTGVEYVVHDLGSTNGTFVNERRLIPDESCPLRSGDQMRLGQLLSIVYISAQESTELNIYLLPDTRPDQPAVALRLTPLFLLQVGQYLQTLQDMHTLLMQAFGESGESFVVQQLKMDDAGRSIEIILGGITPTLQHFCQFLAIIKPPGGKDVRLDLESVGTLPQRPTVEEVKAVPDLFGDESPEEQATRLYVQLAQRLIFDMSGLFTLRGEKPQNSRIATLLQRLLEGQMRLSPVPPVQ